MRLARWNGSLRGQAFPARAQIDRQRLPLPDGWKSTMARLGDWLVLMETRSRTLTFACAFCEFPHVLRCTDTGVAPTLWAPPLGEIFAQRCAPLGQHSEFFPLELDVVCFALLTCLSTAQEVRMSRLLASGFASTVTEYDSIRLRSVTTSM